MGSPSFDNVNKAREHFLHSYQMYWLEHSFLTWQWWILLLGVLIAWTIWWKFVDKRRIHSILNFGLLYGVLSTILDMVGMNHGAWAYPIRLYWAFIPPLLPFDISYLPVAFMLVYQRYGQHTGKAFVAFTVVSAIVSFCMEPLLKWIWIYQAYKWKSIYSFPIYILLALIVRFLVRTLDKKSNINQKHP